jgi:peptidoglycan/xylan/chitin deacetylase (PgdA/CDA1 family)
MKVISVMYHDIVARGLPDESGFAGADAALYKLEREEFAGHLRAIDASVREQAMSTVFDLPQEMQARATPPLLLTFDDGGVSAHTSAAGMLEAYGWRGHFFVTANYIDTPTFLSRAQIKDLHARGHIIGSHSSSHPLRMARCSWDELMDEWRTSIEILSGVIKEAVTVASVPGGYYTRRVAEAAAQSGIKYLFTSEPTARCMTVDGCLVLGRYSIQRWTSAETAAAIASGKLAPRIKQQALWTAKKMTKAVGGEYYLKARRALIGQG